MSARHRRHGPGLAPPDQDQPTPPVASSPQAREPGQPETYPADRLAYSIDEAARLTGLSRDLLYDQMRSGNLAYVKVGRRRLITHHHLQQFLGIAPSRTNPAAVLATRAQAGHRGPPPRTLNRYRKQPP